MGGAARVLQNTGRFARWTAIVMLACLWTLGFVNRAQAQRPLRALVADFTDNRTRQADKPAMQARDAVINELNAVGKAQFQVIARSEMLAVAKTMGIRLPQDPLKPADLPHADWLRLARELKAEALVTGEFDLVSDRKKGVVVVLNILARDLGEEEPLNGAQARQTLTLREGETEDEALPRAVSDAAQAAVKQMLERPQITATVLNVRQTVVMFNKGARDGLRAGDVLQVYRYGANGASTPVGKARVTKVRETESEAKVLTNNGISPEDVARKIYRPAASAHSEK